MKTTTMKSTTMKSNTMNKKIAFMALALLVATGFVSSCGDDDEPEIKTPTPSDTTAVSKDSANVNDVLPEGTFVGWTEGSNPYAGYIPSGGDSLVISKDSTGAYSVGYLSPTHGRGVITGVTVTRNDTAFVFQKPVTVSRNDTAFVFSQVPDTISMPNRNPEGGAVTWKAYPATFDGGYLTLDGERWEFTFQVYCNVRYIHKCIVREGAIGNRKTQQ